MHVLRLAVVPGLLLLCLVLGGASAAGFLSNMMLQLLAIPVILAAAFAKPSTPIPAPGRQLIALLLVMLAVIVVQLLPLPPSIWTQLPGRAPIADGFAAFGVKPPWLPLSLAPYRTVSSFLWLLPAIAVLLAILKLRTFKPAWFAWTVVFVTAFSVVIGVLQIAGGVASVWYFYQITNFGTSTGFFANANHLAIMLVCTFPFLTALYLHARAKQGSLQRNSGLLVILSGAVAVVFVGIAINRSLAGVGLSVPVLAACVLMILSRRERRPPRWLMALVPLLLIASVAAVLSAPIGNNSIGEEARGSVATRSTSFSISLDAAGDFMPVGSGIGSFQQIYRTREDPVAVTREYMNHVHNDYIELALETGAPGLLVLILFLVWWTTRAVSVWRAQVRDPYALAATVASAAILAHSSVEYPLRTAALSAFFAMCLALMAEPRPASRARPKPREAEPPGARHLSAD